jgi:CHAT domain-containing protein/Tfp pilus assembly protein PilF
MRAGVLIVALALLPFPCAAQTDREAAEKLMVSGRALAASKSADDLHRADAAYRQAAELWRRAGDKQKQIEALYGAAWTHYPLREFPPMLALLTSSMDVARTGDFPAARAELLSSFAVVHNEQGEYRKAVDEYAEAAEIQKGLNNPAAAVIATGFEGNAWRLLAMAAEKAKDAGTAVDAYRRAAALFQQAGDPKRAGQQFLQLGLLSRQSGTPAGWEQAAGFYTDAVPLLEAAADRPGLATAWWSLGSVEDSLGHIERSRDAFLKAVPYLSDIPNPKSQAIVLNSLALALDKLNDPPQAAIYYERALPLFAAAHDEPNQFLAAMRLGKARETMGKTGEALAAYHALLPVTQDAHDAAGEANVHSRIGLIQFARRNWQAAMDEFSAAQRLHAGVNDKISEAADWGIIGSVYGNRGQYREKLSASQRELALLEGGANRRAETQTLIDIADSYNALHMSRQALENLDKAQKLAGDDAAQTAQILVESGEVYYADSRLDKALELENQALDIALKLNNPPFVNRIRNDVGLTLQAKGEMTKAREVFERGLASARDGHEVQQTYTELNNLAKLDQDLGDSLESVKVFEQSLALAREDAPGGEGPMLDGLGMSYHMLGQDDKAIATLNQSLTEARANGNEDHEAIALNDLALVYIDIGHPQQALDAMELALAKRRSLQDEAGVADLLRALGGIFQDLGDYDRAETYFAQALETQKQFGDEHGQALTHNSLGVVAMNRHEPQAALREFNQALPLVEKFEDRRGEATVLSNMGNALLDTGLDTGELRDAAAKFGRSLALAREMHYADGEALALHGLGSVYERSGDLERALESYRGGLAVWRELHSSAAESKAHSLIAKVERKQGKTEAAMSEIAESIRLLESQRGALVSEDLRAYFVASISDPWKVQIGLLMDMNRVHPGQGWDVRAFEASEKARARSLLDLLTESRVDFAKDADPKLAAEERASQQSIHAKTLELEKADPGGGEPAKLRNEIADLSAEHDRIEAAIREASTRRAPLFAPEPLTLRQIQTRVLDGQSLLLEYSLGEDRSYIFAVSSSGFSVHDAPKRSEIESAARDVASELQDFRPDRTQFHKDAAALSALLLGPVAAQINTGQIRGKRLIIVGDGELDRLSFGALPNPSTGEPLILSNEVVTEPSASTVAALQSMTAKRKKAAKEIAVFADPVFSSADPRLLSAPAAEIPQLVEAAIHSVTRGAELARLHHSAEEARAILSLVPASQSLALVGFQANKNAVMNGGLADYRMVHFATHGLIDPEHPQLSGLALSLYDEKSRPVDGFLDLNSIFDMKLDSDLVVLSACESGEGKLVGGEGLMGLTRGFFHAGAASLVVSLWSVDDEATSELMRRFYGGMLGSARLRPAAALRAAQRSMISDARWQDPYYWAAFTVQGEWR